MEENKSATTTTTTTQPDPEAKPGTYEWGLLIALIQ